MSEGQKQELLNEREALYGQLEEIREELQQPLDNDASEQPSQLQHRQNLMAVQRRARERLARIEDVLRQLH